MFSVPEQKILIALTEALDKCINEFNESKEPTWMAGYGEYIGDKTVELMGLAAFSVLMGAKDVQKFIAEKVQ